MEAVCKGAKKGGGITIGILPNADHEHANQYVDIAIPTGLGHRRNFLVVMSCQCIIAIGGHWGTLNELSFGFILKKPVVLVRNCGGAVDMLINSNLLKTYEGRFSIVETAHDAVEQALLLIK